MSLGSITENLLQSFDGVIISFIFHVLWSLFFLFRFYLFDTENKNRGSSKQREREKQAPHWEGSPTWSSIPGPQYHNLSWRQTPNQFSHSGTPCSLKFCIAVFTFEEAVTSSSLKYLPSALVGILKLSQTFYGYTCSLLLAPSCGRILKLVWILLILQHNRSWRADSHRLLFPRMARKLKFAVSPLPRVWVAFYTHSLAIYQYSSSLPLGICTGSRPQGGSVNEVHEVLGVPVSQVGGSTYEDLLIYLRHFFILNIGF